MWYTILFKLDIISRYNVQYAESVSNYKIEFLRYSAYRLRANIELYLLLDRTVYWTFVLTNTSCESFSKTRRLCKASRLIKIPEGSASIHQIKWEMQQLGNISKEKTEFLLFIPNVTIHTGQMVAEVKIFLIQIAFSGTRKK